MIQTIIEFKIKGEWPFFESDNSYFFSHRNKIRTLPLFCVLIGCGLFSGYYGREDLTRAVLCDFNGEICCKTGDLGWFNTTNRQLEFRGYRDDQLKLRSQSIELEDIKSVLMEMATNCIVIKAKHIDIYYLVAYVQTTHTIQDLRQYCLGRLPFYLVPSVFVISDTLPGNQTEEINQTNFPPPPDFTSLLMLSNAEKLPRTEMEQRVCKIWYQAFSQIDLKLSISTSFFSLRDNPESFIKLFHLYSINFKHNLSIVTFLKQPTIAEHARLLLESATVSTSFGNSSQSVSVKEGAYNFHEYFSSNPYLKFNCISKMISYSFL